MDKLSVGVLLEICCLSLTLYFKIVDKSNNLIFLENKRFSRMRSKGFPFHSGGVGVELCSPDIAFTSATVRNRPQRFA